MTKNSKKITAISSGIGAVAIAATISFTALTSKPIEISYEIHNNSEYTIGMKINVPQNEEVDLVELYVNDLYVDNALMPNGEFVSIPLVFTNYDNLSFRMYNHGDLCGIGKFEGNKLLYFKK